MSTNSKPAGSVVKDSRKIKHQQSLVLSKKKTKVLVESSDEELKLELQLAIEQEKAEQLRRNRKEHIEQSRLQAKSLLFGLEPNQTYMGHNGVQILQMVENEQMKLNVSYDPKNINLWSAHSCKVIRLLDLTKQHNSIVAVAYTPKYRLYLIVTSDFKFIFLNNCHNVVNTIDMSYLRLVNEVSFYDEKDLLVTAGVDGVFIFKFVYTGNYSPVQADKVDPKGIYIKIKLAGMQKVQASSQWCKGLKIDSKRKIIISWDWQDITISALSHKGELLSQFQDVCSSKSIKITDVLVCNRYLVTATNSSSIFVFKYIAEGKVETQRRLVHTFEGHFKCVASISQFEQFPTLLLSVAFDCTAKIWSLDTFQQQYTFDLPSGLTYIKIYKGCSAIICGRTDATLQTFDLHMILENFVANKATINSLSLAYDSPECEAIGKATYVISVCDDNSAFFLRCDKENREVKTTLYPPPSSSELQSVAYSIRLDRVIVLLTNSTLCVYKKIKETALLESSLEPRQILDSEQKRALNQEITYMGIFQTKGKKQIRAMDTETINYPMHVLSLISALGCPMPYQEFVALGLSKGGVILLHTRQLHNVFVRLTIHRDAITLLKYLPNTQMFVSFCTERYFKLWRCHYKNKKQQILLDIKLQRYVQDLLVFKTLDRRTTDRMLVIWTSGESDLFEFDQENDHFYYLETEKTREHDSKLTGYDYNPNLKLLVTSDNTGIIRIWTEEKKFLREIKFPTPVDTVCFLNPKGDILVSHAQRLSLIKFTTYWSKVFDYYNITVSKNEDELRQLGIDDQSMFCDPDFVITEEPLTKVLITSEQKMRSILSGQKPQVMVQSVIATPANNKSPQNQERKLSANQKQKGVSTQPTAQHAPKRMSLTFIQEPSINRRTSFEPTDSSVQEKDDSQQKRIENFKQLSPFNVTALPRKEIKHQIIQPLPGMSYLSTSSYYYDLQRARSTSKPMRSTRRRITEGRITSNIMSYNQPTSFVDNSQMEVSSSYQTSVQQSKFHLSGTHFGSLFSQKPMPLEYLLQADLTHLSQYVQKPIEDNFQTTSFISGEQCRKIKSQGRTRATAVFSQTANTAFSNETCITFPTVSQERRRNTVLQQRPKCSNRIVVTPTMSPVQMLNSPRELQKSIIEDKGRMTQESLLLDNTAPIGGSPLLGSDQIQKSSFDIKI